MAPSTTPGRPGGGPVGAETETTAFLCESNESAGVGYYGTKGEKMSGPLERQTQPSQWRIDFLPASTTARVTRYSGTLQQIDVPPRLWRVEAALMGAASSSSRRSGRGDATEVITFTGATGAFVYSTQHVNPLWNRASVWVGQCYRIGGE